MTEVVIHIGTPKTGTTAIQQALSENEELLDRESIWFSKVGRHRAAHNDLANAILRHGKAHRFYDKFFEEFDKIMASQKYRMVLLSSEIFSLIRPNRVLQCLPILSDKPLKIIVYFRRQDQYVEAFYKQRLKNGRTVIPFSEFLESRVCERITDYNGLLKGWSESFPAAVIVPRVYQRINFTDGDIVSDFFELLSVNLSSLSRSDVERNLSPSRDVIDILLALSAHFKGSDLRKIFRKAKGQNLPGFSAKEDLFTLAERQLYCAKFDQANKTFHQTYFPQKPELFSPPAQASRDQRAMLFEADRNRPVLLTALLKAAFDLKAEKN